MTASDSGTGVIADAVLPTLRRRLLAWYRRCARDLPWRRHTDNPYAQWLAEMMLHQTRSETVIPYYRKFLKRFPTPRALARASLDDVLSLWAGLGYYARARNLHRAARMMVAEYDGRVPDTIEGLQALPGVGRYTAGAIGSIAYGLRAPVLDGNVVRLLSRLFAVEDDTSGARSRERLWTLAERILPKSRCGDFNQALMELGAVTCTPRTPTCCDCPLREFCRAHAEGTEDQLPRRNGRPATRRLTIISLIVVAGDCVLLRQRPGKGLWAGLWEPPGMEKDPKSKRKFRPQEVLPVAVARRVTAVQQLGIVTHQLTHRLVRFEVHLGSLKGTRPGIRANGGQRPHRWVRRSHLDRLGISRAHQHVLSLHIR